MSNYSEVTDPSKSKLTTDEVLAHTISMRKKYTDGLFVEQPKLVKDSPKD